MAWRPLLQMYAQRPTLPIPVLTRFAAWALCLVAFVVPYGLIEPWWKFVPSTAIMLVCMRHVYGAAWRQRLGLAISKSTCLRATALFLGVAIGGHLLVEHIAMQHGAYYLGPWFNAYRLLPWCQVLNEEIVFRALLLGVCARAGFPLRWVSLSAAALFAISHIAIYRWGLANVWLPPQTTLTLFCFALLTNEMYLRSGHIAYPVALHLGWNLTRFGVFWQFSEFELHASLTHGFNTFEAYPGVVATSIVGCLVTLWCFPWTPSRKACAPRAAT